MRHLSKPRIKNEAEGMKLKYGYLLFFVREWIHSNEFLNRLEKEIPKEPKIVMLYIESSSTRKMVKTMSQKTFLNYEPCWKD